ncbi:unnamed protein product, partial [Sphacelaria rigidula]
CPVNDIDDPYLTADGKLVFAVARAPVDGAPFLVDNVNAFGQAGGFESLIACLSPPEPIRQPALPLPTPARAPLAGAPPPLPPRPPPSTTS